MWTMYDAPSDRDYLEQLYPYEDPREAFSEEDEESPVSFSLCPIASEDINDDVCPF